MEEYVLLNLMEVDAGGKIASNTYYGDTWLRFTE